MIWWVGIGLSVVTVLGTGLWARRNLTSATGPAEADQPQAVVTSVFRHFTTPYRRHLSTAVALTIVGVSIELAAPWPLALVIDNALSGAPAPQFLEFLNSLSGRELIGVAALSGVGLVALGAFVSYLSTYLNGAVQARIGSDMRVTVFDRLQGASIDFHDRHRSGDLLARLSADVGYVDDMLVAWFETAIPESLTVIAIVAVLASIDLTLAALALAVIPVLVWWSYMAHRSVRIAERHARARSGEMLAQADDTLRNARAVQVFSRGAHETAAFHSVSEATATSEVGALDRWARLTPLAGVILAIGSAAVLYAGALRVLSGTLTVGTLVVVVAYVSQLYGPIEALSVLVLAMGRGAASRDRLRELLMSERGVPEPDDPKDVPEGPCALSARHVTFGYGSERPVLSNLSFTVRPNAVTCIVGPSGAGKSSILSLLVRLYDPRRGTIHLGPVDIRDLPLDVLRRHVALVPQDLWIVHGTVADNITFGRPNASESQMRHAAGLAMVDQFIPDLPAGYDTVIGDNGVALSGGQRRRVALARALLLETPILVLDEPTAGLDPISARQVWDAIDTIRTSRAVVLVTHDLDLASRSDQIYVIEAGHNVESGTHQQLLRKNRRYADLWRARDGDTTLDHAAPPAPKTSVSMAAEKERG